MAMVLRSDKVAFYGVPGSGSDSVPTYTRMKYFTSFTTSKNSNEYTRHYVDEKYEQTDVTGISPSIDFGFDEYTPDAVIDDIVKIITEEKIGSDAVRSIVIVDFSKTGSSEDSYVAYKRDWAVIPSSEGGGTDAYTYSGTLKVKSDLVKGTATISKPVSGGTKSNATEITFSAE